jgi:hypothetical protein
MRKRIFVLVLCVGFAVGALGQEPSSVSRAELSWKGNVIDLTTAEQILAKYGKPEKDSTTGFEVFTVNQTFTKETKKKKWRIIKYKTLPVVENIEDVKFAFDSDGKLIFLQFKPSKKASVQGFLKAYQAIKFQPYDMTGISFGLNITAHYSVQGKMDTGYIIALVEYGFLGGRGGTELNKETQSNDTLAGNVTFVQMISKRLKISDQSDIFK